MHRCDGRLARVDHALERKVRDQPGDRKRQLRGHRAAVHDHEASTQLDQPGDCAHHVVVVHTDDDQVVGIVREGRGERSALKPEAADEAEPDPARPEMALDHRDLGEITRRIGEREPVLRAQLLDERLGDDLPRDEPDHPGPAALPRHLEVLGWRPAGSARSASPTPAPPSA